MLIKRSPETFSGLLFSVIRFGILQTTAKTEQTPATCLKNILWNEFADEVPEDEAYLIDKVDKIETLLTAQQSQAENRLLKSQ